MGSDVHITVQSEAIIGQIEPTLTGACLEDVNHEVYGGIYSQMLFGESFEEAPMEIDVRLDPAHEGMSGTLSARAERGYLEGRSEIRSWFPMRQGSAEGHFQHTILRARRGRFSQAIAFLQGEGEIGIENRGLNRWGLYLIAGKPYDGCVTLLAEEATSVTVALERGDGGQVLAQTTLSVPGDKAWHTCPFELEPAESATGARFAIKLTQPGEVWVDYCFLQPGPWGRFKDLPVRRDIVQALIDQGLTVLRYGGYMINTDWEHEARCPGSGYRWKKMIGPRQDRPPYLGTFYPYSSNGFGIIEFVALCEAAGLLCIPAINPSESAEDVADLVEYLNGDVSTPWGARRAADGHPEPYGVRYLQIGNEEGIRTERPSRVIRSDYPALFADLAKAATSRDPELTLIASPWLYKEHELAYGENRPVAADLLEAGRGYKVLWDVHVGGDDLSDGDTVESFVPQLRAYLDDIAPDNQVGFCILEENGQRHDVQRALGHAHIINTVERMAGEVVIDCPANCLQPWQENDNYWDQGQVFFTPEQVWGMPPYFAQQMIAAAYQPLAVQVQISGAAEDLDISATRSEDGNTIILKVVNLAEAEQTTTISPGVSGSGPGRASVSCLAGDLEAANTPDAPTRVAPVETTQPWDGGDLEHAFPGHSFTVIRFECGGA